MKTPYESGSFVYSAVVGGTKVEVTDDAESFVHDIVLGNTTAAVAYLQLFDADSADVTVGTTTPTYAFLIPASATVIINLSKPLHLATGFTIACTTTRTGSTGANVETFITYN